jgi:hypothetical protein
MQGIIVYIDMKHMRTPANRSEFERNFYLLAEQLRLGKYHIAKGIHLGLDKVRYLPNGRIDFLSVDESARLQANSVAHFSSEDIKDLIKKQSSGAQPEDAAGPDDASP